MQDSIAEDDFEPAERVLSPEALLDIDPRTAMFVRTDTGQPPSLEDRQAALSEIRLNRAVPESVRNTFRLAKRLFLFGHFEYGFFTVSQHYAFLALEAAVYCRWVESLPDEVRIDIPPNPPFRSSRTTHQALYELWQRSGRKLKVEGLDFPNSVFKILAEFVKSGLISPEQQERIEAAIHLRNDLSHLELAPINTPSVSLLYTTAEFINSLYSRC